MRCVFQSYSFAEKASLLLPVGLFQRVDLRRHFTRENCLLRYYEEKYLCYENQCALYIRSHNALQYSILVCNFLFYTDNF